MTDSSLPACLEIEQAVLGAILHPSPNADATFGRVAAILDRDDFAEEIHRRIYDVAAALTNEGRPANIVLIKPHLGEHDLGGMTTAQYLARLCAERASDATLDQFARAIREAADMRRLVEAAQMTVQQACAGAVGVKPSRLAADLIERADSIAMRDVSPGMRRVSIGQAGRAALAEVAERKAGKPSRGVLTGIDEIDGMIGALEPGHGSILAGRPSMGKTAVAVQIGYSVAKAGGGVLGVSLEMGAMPLAQRVLSLVTAHSGHGVPYSFVAKGQITDADEGALYRASEAIDLLPFEIEPQPGMNVSQIVVKARQVKKMFEGRGIPLRLVIVDHIGLVRPSSRYSGNRVLEVGEISAALHGLARELDVHVMMLCQLNREVEKRADKRPQLSDLRDSGDLEQNADIVFGAYRESYYLENSGDPADAAKALDLENEMELAVLKNRQGPRGTAKLYANMACNVVRSAGYSPPTRPHLRAVTL